MKTLLAILLFGARLAFAQDDTAQAKLVYAEVNQQQAKLTKISFVAKRPDVEYASEVTTRTDTNSIRKIEITDRDEDGDVVSEYYFANEALVFVYQITKGFNDATGKQVVRSKEREYFRDGKMFKWLSGIENTPNTNTGAAFGEEAKLRLKAAAFFLASSQAAMAADNMRIGNEMKPATAVVTQLENGDVACYLTLKDSNGFAHNELANFELCDQKPAIKNKRVRLSYTAGSVMADECQGDPDCKKTRKVLLVSEAKIITAQNASSAVKK